MTIESRIGPDGRDDDLTRALRALYAPPSGTAYWEALEHRILARMTSADEDLWWRQIPRWRHGIAVAGVAALLLTAFAARHSSEARSLEAYKAIEATRIAPIQVASETDSEASRDVTLRYVVGP
jgi:hypothetical protein